MVGKYELVGFFILSLVGIIGCVWRREVMIVCEFEFMWFYFFESIVKICMVNFGDFVIFCFLVCVLFVFRRNLSYGMYLSGFYLRVCNFCWDEVEVKVIGIVVGGKGIVVGIFDVSE